MNENKVIKADPVQSEWELSPKDAYMEDLIPNEMMSEAGVWEEID